MIEIKKTRIECFASRAAYNSCLLAVFVWLALVMGGMMAGSPFAVPEAVWDLGVISFSLVGLGLALIALFGIRQHGKYGIVCPALVGLALNGLLLLIFLRDILAPEQRIPSVNVVISKYGLRLYVGLFAAGFLALGLWLGAQSMRRLLHWTAGHGTIVGFKGHSASAGGGPHGSRLPLRLSAPKVTFTIQSGGTFAFESKLQSSSKKYQIGDQVPIRFCPQKPAQAEIVSFQTFWLFPVLFLFLGAAAGVIFAGLCSWIP